MATTILMEPASLTGKMIIKPKAVALDFKGRKSTNSFSPKECMMASYKLKEALQYDEGEVDIEAAQQ